MDPNPRSFPLVSYVMSRIPSFAPRHSTAASPPHVDIEQPFPSPTSHASSSSSSFSAFNHPELGRMPHLSDPKLLASMTRAISDVAQTRYMLKLIGERPDHETVDNAKAKLVDMDAHLSRQLEEIVLSPRPPNIDILQWRTHQAEKEKECRKIVEDEKQAWKSVIQLDEMHDAYERLLKDAEKRLVEMYKSAEDAEEDNPEREEVNEEVVGILQQANEKPMERVDLSDRHLRWLPEAFGRISGLVVLNLSVNQLVAIPDSIAGLQNIEELNVSSNLLESLPDSIGLLQKLKFLNVSGNKLNALPDSISQCRSLVELDAGFNSLTYLPTNIGYELKKLQKLLIHLNKLRSLPSSVCELTSLRYLDAHFNELNGLPDAIGRLTNLEVINLSSNFSDLRELPETFGDLINLRELDLSNNQILALPDTFGRLGNLTKLNLEQNPLELPPMEIVKGGVHAVKNFMTTRLIDILNEEERSKIEMQDQAQMGWLTRSTSWLKTYVSGVSESVTEYASGSPKSPRHAYLNQQL